MEHKKKTLVILTPGFPAEEKDSTCLPERQVLVQALTKNFPGLHIVVLAFQYPFEENHYKWYGAEVHSFNGRNRSRLSRVGVWVRVWKALERLRRRHEVIGLLSFWLGECALVGSRFARLYGLSHFCWILGQDARRHNKYVRWSGVREHELIALSDFLSAKLLVNYGLRPAHTIPPGIDPQLFGTPSSGRPIDILGAGSLIPLKRYTLFLQIIRELKKDHPSLKAVLCGKGPEMQMLQELINEWDLSSNVELKGELPHGEVLRLMQQSKVFLHPSSYEGWGVVCLEALYAGAHVVSSCRPMAVNIPQFHFATTNGQLLAQVQLLLKDETLSHESVAPFLIQDCARRVIELYA
jgi:glycosyltransferase involved in cell wall biosynthesis